MINGENFNLNQNIFNKELICPFTKKLKKNKKWF